MTELIAEILLLFEELKFWKKKKARRKFERENKLPKKTMIHPVVKVLILMLIFLVIVWAAIGIFGFPGHKHAKTVEKMTEIRSILEKEKRDTGVYPGTLETIIRNNPLRKNIHIDPWGHEFHYRQLDNGQRYVLISKGKDGIINTKDDIE